MLKAIVISLSHPSMSQPVALIAKIPLPLEDFKKFRRSRASRVLVRCLADEIRDPISKYMVFRYLKPESALFAFFYFNYGNASLLRESTEWEVLQTVASYARDGRSGFVLHSLDALNIPEEITAVYVVANGECQQTSWEKLALDEKQLKQDCQRYFFKPAEDMPFVDALGYKRIIDASIVRRSRALLEAESQARSVQEQEDAGEAQALLLMQLQAATPGEPIHFFGHFYFNGQQVYGMCSDEVQFFPEINPVRFRSVNGYGMDDQCFVLGDRTWPGSSEHLVRLTKGEMTFYKTLTQVWSWNGPSLTLLPMADAASFKLKSADHAEDANHVYLYRTILPKAELGAYRLCSYGYYTDYKLLIGERAVYLGADRVPLDAASFVLEHNVQDDKYAENAYVVSDVSGRYVLTRDINPHTRTHQALRLVPVADLAEAKAWFAKASQDARHAAQQARESEWNDPETMLREELEDLIPRDDAEAAQLYVQGFSRWAENFYPAQYAEHRWDPWAWLYRGVNNYFYTLFSLNRPQDVIDFYPRIADTAWLNPNIFHHTACSYAALGQAEAALQEVHRAVVFGYEHVELLWSDPDLAILHGDRRFQALAAHTRGPRPQPAAPELLKAILQAPPPQYTPAHCSDGFKRELESLAARFSFAAPPTDAPDVERTAQLWQLFSRYLNHYLVEPLPPEWHNRRRVDLYRGYAAHPMLHPLAHWVRFAGLYKKAHNETLDRELLAQAMALVAPLQAAVAAARQGQDSQIQAEIEQEAANSALFRWVLSLDV